MTNGFAQMARAEIAETVRILAKEEKAKARPAKVAKQRAEAVV
jgi:hypothetical protein